LFQLTDGLPHFPVTTKERPMSIAAIPVTRSRVPLLSEHVRVPDGRIGTVLGFYNRGGTESVLLLFSPGHASEFPFADLKLG
jgi:hypothetical protein